MDALIPVLVGLVVIPAVNFLKAKLGWDGKKAQLLAAGVSAVFAVGYLAATGALLPVDLENLAEKVALVFATSQLVYRLVIA